MGFPYRAGFFVSLGALVICAGWSVRAGHFASGSASLSSVAPPADATSTTETENGTCVAELAACRSNAWNLALHALQTAPTETSEPRAHAIEGDASDDVDYGAQRRELCDIAETQAREQWKNSRENIMKSVHDVGTAAWAKDDVAKTIAQAHELLGTSPAEDRALESGYASLLAQHGDTLQRLIQANDYSALRDEVRAIWREQDALIVQTLGTAARDDYRATQLRSRTAIIAILTTLDDQPFDETMTW